MPLKPVPSLAFAETGMVKILMSKNLDIKILKAKNFQWHCGALGATSAGARLQHV
jgi:hypothetical protein